jgi:hypothetical protein
MINIVKNMLITLVLLYIFNNFNNIHNEHFKGKKKKIHYVYWTGGYDSTYRICDLLINKKKFVQPIYLLYNLDNDSEDKYWVRKNRAQEVSAMYKIRQKIYDNFPNTKEKFFPTWIIDKEVIDTDYTKKFDKINSELFPRKRRVHQYEHLGRYAYQLKEKVDLGFVGIHDKSKIVQFLNKNLQSDGDNFVLPTSHPLGYVNFPLFGITKAQMFENAKKNNFDNILKLTWSCWFPKTDGTPCGNCPMCKERVIEHPNLISV